MFVRGRELDAAAHLLSHHLPELVMTAKHTTKACRATLSVLPDRTPPHLGPPYLGHCYQPGCHLSCTSLPWALIHQSVMHPWQLLRGPFLKQERQTLEAGLVSLACPMASACHTSVRRCHRLARHVALAHRPALQAIARCIAATASLRPAPLPLDELPRAAVSQGATVEGGAAATSAGAGRPNATRAGSVQSGATSTSTDAAGALSGSSPALQAAEPAAGPPAATTIKSRLSQESRREDAVAPEAERSAAAAAPTTTGTTQAHEAAPVVASKGAQIAVSDTAVKQATVPQQSPFASAAATAAPGHHTGSTGPTSATPRQQQPANVPSTAHVAVTGSAPLWEYGCPLCELLLSVSTLGLPCELAISGYKRYRVPHEFRKARRKYMALYGLTSDGEHEAEPGDESSTLHRHTHDHSRSHGTSQNGSGIDSCDHKHTKASRGVEGPPLTGPAGTERPCGSDRGDAAVPATVPTKTAVLAHGQVPVPTASSTTPAAPTAVQNASATTADHPQEMTPRQRAAAKAQARYGPWPSLDQVQDHISRYHEPLLLALAAYVHGRGHGLEGGKCPFAAPEVRLHGDSGHAAYSVSGSESQAQTSAARSHCPGSAIRWVKGLWLQAWGIAAQAMAWELQGNGGEAMRHMTMPWC